VTVRGRLAVGAGGELVLAASPIDVQSGGTLSLVGASANRRAQITGGGVGGWSATIGPGAILEASHFLVQEMGAPGLRVDLAAALGAAPLDLRDGIFDRVAANGAFLVIDRAAPAVLQDLQFRDSAGVGASHQPGTRNVRVGTGSALVTIEAWKGAFGGEQFEDDPGARALWGSRLSSFTVRERAGRNEVAWRAISADDALSFHLERAPDLAGSFLQIGPDVASIGPGLYRLSDSSVAPGTPYRYRLRETLAVGPPVISEILAEVRVDGIEDTNTQAKPQPPTPTAALVAEGEGGGPSGTSGTLHPGTPLDAHGLDLQALLDAALAGDGGGWIEVELPAGRHSSFTFEALAPHDLRVVAARGAAAEIDVRSLPLRIRGVPAGRMVELSGFTLDAGGSQEPAIVVEDCAGVVLLDRLEVRGTGSTGVRLERASAVVLQDVLLPELGALALERGSRASCRGGRLHGLRVVENSLVESWGAEAVPEVDATSRWLEHPAMPGELALEEVGDELFLLVEGTPGARWVGLVGLGLRLDPAPVRPTFLLTSPRRLGAPRTLGPDGRDQLPLRLSPSLALLGCPLFLQARFDADARVTPVRSFRPEGVERAVIDPRGSPSDE
jgi:hypothetical protein